MNKSVGISDKEYKEWVKRNIYYCKQFYLLYSPVGTSEYDLERFYPKKIEGTMPTIEELVSSLGDE